MSRLIQLSAIPLLLAGCMPADSQNAKQDGSLVIATWNVEWLFDDYTGDNYARLAKEQSAPSRADWEWKRDGVAAAIAQIAPNVIALQEVEGGRTLFYLQQAIERNHEFDYRTAFIEGRDHYTEQDVGLLVKEIDLLRYGRREQSSEMFASDRYHSVSKHIEADLQWTATGEPVFLFSVHLRAGPDNAEIRTRQARTLHAWLQPLLKAEANVIVLGDLNSETNPSEIGPQTDLGVLTGKETEDASDDLVDLAQFLPRNERRTHLAGKQYDRIFVSQPLIDDDPQEIDLVFESIRVRSDLVVRGRPDTADQHWDDYWDRPESERDLSDHFPVVATFVPK